MLKYKILTLLFALCFLGANNGLYASETDVETKSANSEEDTSSEKPEEETEEDTEEEDEEDEEPDCD